MLTRRGAKMLRGNTDRYVCSEPLALFDNEEAERIAWTRRELGERWLTFLRELPASLTFEDGLHVFHANPLTDDEHVWPDADDATLEHYFGEVPETIVIFGHLHLPYVRTWRGRTLVNVASVGIPKDTDLRAAYTILTRRESGWEIKQRRVDFDRDKVVRQLRKSGMPNVKDVIKTFERARYGRISGPVP